MLRSQPGPEDVGFSTVILRHVLWILIVLPLLFVGPAVAQESQQDQDGRTLYLSLVGRDMSRQDLQRPAPDQPTADPGTTPIPSATATATPTVQPTAPVCRTELASRPVARPLRLEGSQTVRQPRGGGWWTHNPIVTAPLDDRVSWVGWSADRHVRFAQLAGLSRRVGPDVTVMGAESTHGLVAHDDGGAAAVVRDGRVMRLVRWDAEGTLRFETDIVGTDGSGAGAKWIDDWPHEGRLVWDGQVYAAYFGHTQNFGARGKHQGDLLWLFDSEGRRLEGEALEPVEHPSWDWGCSHSIDVRMILHPSLHRLGTLCLSDSFPSPGIVFEQSLLLNQEPSADGNGNVDAALGGIAPADEGFAVTYVSGEGRRSHDVAMRRVYDEENDYGPPWWLTSTPDEDERSAHLAAYGDHLMAGWMTGAGLNLAIVTQRGQIIEGPTRVTGGIQQRDDFITYPNGDMGWAYSDQSGQNLWSVRVPLCRPAPAAR